MGTVAVGGGAPVSVQTMLTADPHDADALAAQLVRCAAAGADVVRLTVPDLAAAALAAVRRLLFAPDGPARAGLSLASGGSAG